MSQDKKYMVTEWNPANIQAMAEKHPMEFKKTGKAETILGYKCEQWMGKDEKREFEVWVTKGLGRFIGFDGGNSKSKSAGWERE
ncbi:DUF4412 domain-containing protein, partial [Alicyclobacillus fructus]|uniref:DUF4412 domain-containing protein n=1 Tax=Alicyclobacillus fructus TaxID=2816082 RepID=UPI0022A7CD3D